MQNSKAARDSRLFPVLQNETLTSICCGLTLHYRLRRHHADKDVWTWRFLKMLQIVLVIFAGASLFGLTGFLFRDQITSERWFRGAAD
jgi:hypothetical protein